MLPAPENIRYVQADQLSENSVLIDVRSPDAFERSHIGGAINFCVYEIAFIDKVKEYIAQLDQTIVVYGESKAFRGADYAFQKLTDAGYTNISVLEGGLANHQKSSFTSDIESGTFKIDRMKSSIRWFGRNLSNGHEGTIGIKEGSIDINGSGELSNGMVVADMNAIDCSDLTEESGKNGLIAHLASSDFFEVSKYPISKFELKEVNKVASSNEGSPNLSIKGDFKIRGKTLPFEFQAQFYPIENGYGLQAQFDLNRVKWGVLYGSGSVFESLGMHLVCDLVSLHLQLYFNKP